MRKAGIVLCGGESVRMGTAKATLPFGPEVMLRRVVRLLSEVVESIVVVAAQGQELPRLPVDVLIAYDQHAGRGPLEGLAAGLTAIGDRADAAYATGCDVPLLAPAFVSTMFDLLGDQQIAVPREGKFYHPLAAVYRTSVLPDIQRLLAADRLRPFFLFAETDTREVAPEAWADVDPQSHTLTNLNCPDDYLSALRQAGFAAEPDVVDRLNRADRAGK